MISREIQRPQSDGTTRKETLEFGVSGSLYNANVLMYDRTDKALWSQIHFRAVSGPLVGMELSHLPAKVVPFSSLVANHPRAEVVSKDTGFNREYAGEDYTEFAADASSTLVDVRNIGDELPIKALGIGIMCGNETWFVTKDAIGDGYTLATECGEVLLSSNEAGVVVESAPTDVHSIQTYYFSWSASHPKSRIISE